MGSDTDSEKITGKTGDSSPTDADGKRHKQQSVGSLLDKIQRTRESGDFLTARDYCREWLLIEPNSERAHEIMVLLEATLGQEREDLVNMNRCRDLVLQNRYREAIDLLDTLSVKNVFCDSVRELRTQALQKLNQSNCEENNLSLLDEASRLLELGHLDMALARLNNLEMQDQGESQILRRKIEREKEVRTTEKTLTLKLMDALARSDLETARIWLGMIWELNPRTEIFEVLRKSLDPEHYQNLTLRILLT